MIHNQENGTLTFENESAKGVKLHEAHGVEYVQVTIKAGGEIPGHPMAIPATFCVIAGEGVFTLEEEVFNAKSVDMIECPADAIRGWRNDGTGDLHLLVIKHSSPKA